MTRTAGYVALALLAAGLAAAGCAATGNGQAMQLSATVTASAWENVADGGWKDFPPEKTLDGSLEKLSSWRAEAEGPNHGQWIQYDLGSVRTVTQLRIALLQGDERMYRFDIAVSRDGAAWTALFSGENSGRAAGFEDYDVPDTPARYVRLTGYGNRAASGENKFPKWINVLEVEIWGR